jgi:1-deoxy-D-xylulose-5-phosphate synthase
MIAINRKMRLLNKLKSPSDIKKFSVRELETLAIEVRTFLIKTIAKNGGHLASNLGTVELSIALHYVYNSPKDKLVWDVGHQAYTHKLLTGRYGQFSNIRKMGGISGYLKIAESEHDAFGAGHAGTAVSAALGMAEARDLKGEDNEVIAILGDGSLTNGLTYEGINNIGERSSNITLVLNDNKWSISKNVGAMAKYLARLSSIHISEDPKTDFESIFHALGFTYFGPIEGHNTQKLINTFKLAKETKGPKLIHVITTKGSGYEYSELSPDKFHFTSPFILESGKLEKKSKGMTYSEAFGNAMIRLAKKDKTIVGITAAMPSGTGLEAFAKEFPLRFFDTGIAESHAVTFAGGLAISGMKPVVAIYSSFLQRAYDQILHDICLQKLPVVFGVDRAGIVGSDGPTHHGLFDLSYLRNIPCLSILAPKDENELGHMLSSALKAERPVAIRYPRGEGYGVKIDERFKNIPIGKAEKLLSGKDVAILAVGTMVYPAVEAAQKLAESDISATVYNVRSIKPIDQEMITSAIKIGNVITVEENVLDGGFGSSILEEVERRNAKGVNIKRIGISGFVEHGEISELKEKHGLTAENIFQKALESVKTKS